MNAESLPHPIRRRPRRAVTLRAGAGTAALLAVALVASACDVSPYAATVGSHVIKVASLDSILKEWAGTPSYVNWFDSVEASANQSSTSAPPTVEGDSTSTYNSSWVAYILTQMITAEALQQHLAATGDLPDQALLNAARSVSEFENSSAYWYDLPVALRDSQVLALADQAAVLPPGATSDIRSAYTQDLPYFFSEVCVNQATEFSLASAQAVVASKSVGGATLCYDQASLEQEPASYRTAIMNTAVGDVASPIKTSFGYDVVEVAHRVWQGYSAQVRQVLAALLPANAAGPPPAIAKVVDSAHVRVNPAYGSWSATGASAGQVSPPQLSGS